MSYDPGVGFEIDGLMLRIDDGYLFPWCEKCGKKVEYCLVTLGRDAAERYSLIDDYLIICHGKKVTFTMDTRKN